MRRQIIAIGVAVAALGRGASGRPADKFDTRTVDFAVAFHGETSAYRDVSAFLLPRESMTIEAAGGPPGDYALKTEDGEVVPLGPHKWKWIAPAASKTVTLHVDGPAANDTITLHVFVMVPAAAVSNGFLNGYRIGQYPARPLNGDPMYLPPKGFVEVTKDNQDIKVSPHFTLKQFLCKEDTTKQFPKYIVLRERLPLKLEAILERVNGLGFHVDTLHVMSAFRTPYYNHAIGDVLYSQHQWGSAADVFIDGANAGRMDDLTGDRRVDIDDSRYLYDQVERLTNEPATRKFEGGLGFYRGTSAHPPFVHVDVRGKKARWKG
jgi:hypothetical protein